MSCVGNNYIVPSADPCAGGGGGGGVNSIIAGTNITIDPVTGLGNVTINSSPAITIVGTPPIVVEEHPSGTYTISFVPTATYTWPDFVVPNGSTVDGGGIAPNYGTLTIPAFIDPAKNPTLTLTIVMCGIGTKLSLFSNNLFVGLFYDTNNNLALGYSSIDAILPSINWGTALADPLNVTFTGTFNTADLISNPLFCSFFVSFPDGSELPCYQFDNLIIRVSTTYSII